MLTGMLLSNNSRTTRNGQAPSRGAAKSVGLLRCKLRPAACALIFRWGLPMLIPLCAMAATDGFVGSGTCKTCHPDIWSAFYRNPHYQSIASGKEPPERTGCESCHGPGKAHVEAHGGKATIVAFSQLEPRAILDNCLRCHSQTLSRTNIRRSSHTMNGVVCTSC